MREGSSWLEKPNGKVEVLFSTHCVTKNLNLPLKFQKSGQRGMHWTAPHFAVSVEDPLPFRCVYASGRFVKRWLPTSVLGENLHRFQAYGWQHICRHFPYTCSLNCMEGCCFVASSKSTAAQDCHSHVLGI